MLPQLLFVAALVVALVLASRWMTQEVDRVDRQMARLQRVLERAGQERILQLRLEFDEATGLYVPVKRRLDDFPIMPRRLSA